MRRAQRGLTPLPGPGASARHIALIAGLRRGVSVRQLAKGLGIKLWRAKRCARELARNASGVTAVEWALIAALIALPAAHYMPQVEAAMAAVARGAYARLNTAACNPDATAAPGTVRLVC
jgi:Flp pilus assembly pilin Flp